MKCSILRWFVPGLLILMTWKGSAQTNGIFADFTTSMGNFTCQLSYSNSPIAVANFIGLATGQHPWLDLVTGEVQTIPFYDGLIFHRVITNFVIQSGSRKGDGTDGPGYAFVDQFNPNLNFNAPWVLAMANSGTNSNGSQFFITVAPFTFGNNTYVIFGRVVSGTNVVVAINHVATDKTTDKPLTNVVIQQVVIRRVGDAAAAFDINAHGLPVVTDSPASIQTADAGSVSVAFNNQTYSDNRWYESTNLTSWTAHEFGIEIAAPTSNSVVVATTNSPQKFFRFAQIQYPSTTLAPKNVLGRTLTMIFAGGFGTNKTIFNASGGGTYTFPGQGTGSGTISSYVWLQEPYRGRLYPIDYSGLVEMALNLNFTNATRGNFSGTAYTFPSTSVSGSFTLTGP